MKEFLSLISGEAILNGIIASAIFALLCYVVVKVVKYVKWVFEKHPKISYTVIMFLPLIIMIFYMTFDFKYGGWFYNSADYMKIHFNWTFQTFEIVYCFVIFLFGFTETVLLLMMFKYGSDKIDDVGKISETDKENTAE
jgi:hypothetical protein